MKNDYPVCFGQILLIVFVTLIYHKGSSQRPGLIFSNALECFLLCQAYRTSTVVEVGFAMQISFKLQSKLDCIELDFKTFSLFITPGGIYFGGHIAS